MFKRIFSFVLTLFMTLCLSTVYAATPQYGADKAVLAYAEMYAFGESENLPATGMPQKYSDSLKEFVQDYSMLAFHSYPLNKENFTQVKTRLLERLPEVLKISTRLKVDDAENPVVEVTANHIDQDAIDKWKSRNGNLANLDIMIHLGTPEELAMDPEFQEVATMSIMEIVNELPVTESTTYDVTCKLIEYEGQTYWMPQDLEGLSKFVSPVFEVQPIDPERIDAMITQIFSGDLNAEENAKAENDSPAESATKE